jgi:tetratricopeptide (TPR) repeat protein
MHRFPFLMFVCCLAVSGCRKAETANEFLDRGIVSERAGDYDKAIAAYTEAIEMANVNDPNTKQIVSEAYSRRARARDAKGERDIAMDDYDQAVTADPKSLLNLISRGNAWTARGEHAKAIADYNRALTINPNFDTAYFCRGVEWRIMGGYDKAIADFTKALAIDSKDFAAYGALAKIYATCPDAKYRDGRKAVEYANKSYQLRRRDDFGCFDTLAAAYAESGDFAKAREFEAKAVELASERVKPQLSARLELYKQGKPYHEPPVK